MRDISMFAVLAMAALSACADNNAQTGESANATGQIQQGDIVANNVIVDDNGFTTTLGAMRFSLGEPDSDGGVVFTGRVGAPQPAGPKIVYVFKRIPPEAVQTLAQMGKTVVDNTAYLLPEGGALNTDSFKKMELVGSIDPALSNDDIAVLFGLEGYGAEETETGEADALPSTDDHTTRSVDHEKISELAAQVDALSMQHLAALQSGDTQKVEELVVEITALNAQIAAERAKGD